MPTGRKRAQEGGLLQATVRVRPAMQSGPGARKRVRFTGASLADSAAASCRKRQRKLGASGTRRAVRQAGPTLSADTNRLQAHQATKHSDPVQKSMTHVRKPRSAVTP